MHELAVRGVEADEVEENTFLNTPLPISLACDPIFFEQRNYSLYAEVREENSSDHKLDFEHENVSLRKCITPLGHYESRLSGNLNFSNDIGMSDLIFKLDGHEYLRITIEVYPTKNDYRKDYQAILADVTAEVYNLAFDAFRRTYESYSLNGMFNSPLIEFLTIIRKIYREFTIAADMIIARPHHVLQSDHVVLPQHKIRRTVSKTLLWLERHPEHVKRVANGYAADRALAVQKYVTYDTRENRLAKYVLTRTAKRLELFKRQYMKSGRQTDAELNTDIDWMIRGIQRRYTNTFLKNIEAEPSEFGMSLVFSMAPGYRDLFKYYLMLQRGLNVTGGVFHVFTKDMADLYEYWCFIKLNSILRESGYRPVWQDFVKVKRNGIFVTLARGNQSTIRYETDRGELIELSYNPSKAHATVPQKPDNVLSLKKKVAGENCGVVSGGAGGDGGTVDAGVLVVCGGETDVSISAAIAAAIISGNEKCYEYVFDAKYRIGANEKYLKKHHNLPGPMEDDINTMHRYRDAIVCDMNRKDPKDKEFRGPYDRTMFGAYVLFPYTDEKNIRNMTFIRV